MASAPSSAVHTTGNTALGGLKRGLRSKAYQTLVERERDGPSPSDASAGATTAVAASAAATGRGQAAVFEQVLLLHRYTPGKRCARAASRAPPGGRPRRRARRSRRSEPHAREPPRFRRPRPARPARRPGPARLQPPAPARRPRRHRRHQPRLRRPRPAARALHGRRRGRVAAAALDGRARRDDVGRADRRGRRLAHAASAGARHRRRPAGGRTARCARARSPTTRTRPTTPRWAATPTCSTAGCRPTRRRATASTATRSRCSRWAASEPLPEAPGRDALMEVLEARAIASGMIIGTYERHDTTVTPARRRCRQGAARLSGQPRRERTGRQSHHCL